MRLLCTQVKTINIYSHFEISKISLYNVIRIVLRWEKSKYMLKIKILRNYSLNILGLLGVIFEGLGVKMMPRHPAG